MTTHTAILVPERLATATSDWLLAERISWPGEDIDLVAKVGKQGESVIDGDCTDSDGLREASRGNVVCVLSLISCSNEGDLGQWRWTPVGRMLGYAGGVLIVNRENTHRTVNGTLGGPPKLIEMTEGLPVLRASAVATLMPEMMSE